MLLVSHSTFIATFIYVQFYRLSFIRNSQVRSITIFCCISEYNFKLTICNKVWLVTPLYISFVFLHGFYSRSMQSGSYALTRDIIITTRFIPHKLLLVKLFCLSNYGSVCIHVRIVKLLSVLVSKTRYKQSASINIVLKDRVHRVIWILFNIILSIIKESSKVVLK